MHLKRLLRKILVVRVFFYITLNMTYIGKTTFNAMACGASSQNVVSTSHSQLTNSQSSRINPLSCATPYKLEILLKYILGILNFCHGDRGVADFIFRKFVYDNKKLLGEILCSQ